MKPLQKLTLRDFQNLMSVIDKEHSNKKFGEIIGRAGSTVNNMINILISLKFIDRKVDLHRQIKTFTILRNDLNFEELKDYIGSSFVERPRIVGDIVVDNLELLILPWKAIQLQLTGIVSTVKYGF